MLDIGYGCPSENKSNGLNFKTKTNIQIIGIISQSYL